MDRSREGQVGNPSTQVGGFAVVPASISVRLVGLLGVLLVVLIAAIS